MAQTKTEEKTAYDLIREARAQVTTLKPMAGKSLEAELYDAAVAGKAVVVIRPFKADGKHYEIGDRIILEPTSKLLTPRWVTTEARFDANRQMTEQSKFLRDVIAQEEALLGRYIYQEQEAIRALSAAQDALRQAQQELKDAQGRKRTQENVIVSLFEGPELS